MYEKAYCLHGFDHLYSDTFTCPVLLKAAPGVNAIALHNVPEQRKTSTYAFVSTVARVWWITELKYEENVFRTVYENET